MASNCLLLIFSVCLTLILVQGAKTQQPNVVVRISNMTESMKQDAIRITKQGFIKFNGYTPKSRSSLAQYIRYEFDQLHRPSWQCIIGKDYALSITSENEKRIILDVDKVAVLIFKGKC
jgi:dynein light chain LC8-type